MALAGAVTLAAAISLRAQTVEIEDDANVRTAIEGVFEHLEKDRVPTGLLLDYATDLVDLSYYDGVQTVDSNAVDAAALDYILRSIRSASVTGTKPFGTVSGIFETYSASGNDITNLRSANIGIAAFRYSYLPADALTSGRIDYVNGQVYDRYDADSTWINPYDSAYVFAFSPFDNYLSAGSVTFTFPAGAIFTNLNVISMEFDAGVGGGYVQKTIRQCRTCNRHNADRLPELRD